MTGDAPLPRRDGAGELPLIRPSLLDRPPACGERARRILAGNVGRAHLGDARFAVVNRLRGDARLAHAVMGAPAPHHFPGVPDLPPEQRVQYRAGARGYLTLFGAPARALDSPGTDHEEPDLGLRLSPPHDLVVELADGRVEVRLLRIEGRAPRVPEATGHLLALRGATWGVTALRVVAADLINLEIVETEVAVDDPSRARAWLAEAHARLVTASRGPARAADECQWCTFVWDCSVHAGQRP